MEFTCTCIGKAWRLRLTAHDAESIRWLPVVFEAAGQPLPAARQVEPHVWLFEDSLHREHATNAEPVIDVHLRQDGPHGEAWVTLDGLETHLDNRAPAVPDPVLGDLVRVATPDETMALALRCFIAHEHLGCREPEELCMWGKLTTATAYAVDDVKGWIKAGTPLPEAAPGTPGLAVFLARMGTISDVQAAMDHHRGEASPGGHRAGRVQRGRAPVARGRGTGGDAGRGQARRGGGGDCCRLTGARSRSDGLSFPGLHYQGFPLLQ